MATCNGAAADRCSTVDVELDDKSGTTNFRKRYADDLEMKEKQYLEALNKEGLKKLRSAKLRAWPVFFPTKEECGEEMQHGLVMMWTNYLVVALAWCNQDRWSGAIWNEFVLITYCWCLWIALKETLLAAVAIQPLVSTQNDLDSSEQKVFGLLWMLALLSDFLGLAITAVFLGFLLSCPAKLTWFWLCELGCIRRLPTLILMFDTVMSLVAIAYSTWILYGFRIGALCLLIEVTCISIGISIYRYLSSTIEVTRSLE